MPSSATTSGRLQKMATGEKTNVWGVELNTNFDLLDSMIAGFMTVALTGNYTLTSQNYAADEARSGMLKFTGGAGPFVVTIPSVSKTYLIWNATSGLVTLTTGAGSTVTLDAGDKAVVFCDAAAVYEPGYGGLGLKAYISSVAAGGAGGNVPSPAGHSGKWLTNNGTVAAWGTIEVAEITDYAADQAAKRTTATNLAAAFAVAL